MAYIALLHFSCVLQGPKSVKLRLTISAILHSNTLVVYSIQSSLTRLHYAMITVHKGKKGAQKLTTSNLVGLSEHDRQYSKRDAKKKKK
jgi:hypothetical protein